MQPILYTAAYYFTVSLFLFILYWIDKRAARKDKWRVKEKTLHITALLGGWPGALAAQKFFRHKTVKKKFQIVFWLTVIANSTVLIFTFMKLYRR